MKNMIKKIGAVLLSLVISVSLLAGCGSGQPKPEAPSDNSDSTFRTLEEIKESGTINIGVFSDKSPFGYVDENGTYQGYDVYFANRIGEDLGVKINYISTEAANRIEYLQTGKVDIILANFTVTPERAQEVDFALPYMNVALGVVSPENAVITSLDQIGAEDEVIVISGTTAETYGRLALQTKSSPGTKKPGVNTIPAILADSLSGERPETFAGNSALISWKRPFSTSPSMRKLKTP